MIYRLLGDLQVGGGDLLLELPGGPTLILLAALLINANRRMPKAALMRAAWGQDDVGAAQLPKRIKMLRDWLAELGRQEDIRTHPGFGYELRVAEEDLDFLLFRKLIRQADEAETQRRPDAVIGALRTALDLWRGPHPLANVLGEAFLRDTRALEQRRKRAASRFFDLEFACGNHQGVLDDLISMADSYPSDQRLCEQLMRAQYLGGHVADVTETYERYRAALEDETGSEPASQLRDFHFAVARGDEAAIAAALDIHARRVMPPAVQAAALVPAQLPKPTNLVGRDDLLAEVKWLFGPDSGPAMSVIVISGPGGIGKTALALRAAHELRDRYPDGQLFMELRGGLGEAADTGEVAAQFLRSLGAPRIPETKAERLADYRTMLAGRRTLIVLDDAADGSQVSELIPAQSGCAVLVTARQRLPDLNDAHHVAPLEPLDDTDAAELFLRVVRDAGITVEDDRESTSRVVELCAGLPLALRIAGALRVHDHPMPTADLAERLARQGPDGLEYGKLSVARTIGAGLERLDPPARRLFLELGLLALSDYGKWTAIALLENCQHGQADGGGKPPDGQAALGQLAASFMLESAWPQARYRFHDLTRDYASRRALVEYRGDRDEVPLLAYRALLTLTRHAHAQIYGGAFEVVHSDIPDWDAPASVLAEVEADPLAWFEAERRNIRAAVAHCAELGLAALCWDLAVSAHEFYTIRGYYDDWFQTHTQALAACRAAGDLRGEGIVLACMNQPALVASRKIDSAAALADLERSAGLLGDRGDRHAQAIILRTLAHALRRRGQLTRPLELLEDVLDHYTASSDQVGMWQTLRFIGQTYLDQGNPAVGRQQLEAAEAIALELGNERLLAQTRYWIGQTCLSLDDLDAAQVAFDSVYDVFRDVPGVGYAYARHGLGDVAWRTGALSVAEQHLMAAVQRAKESPDSSLEGRAWLSVAGLRLAMGQGEAQLAALNEAVSVLAASGAARIEARALMALAQALERQGDSAGAAAALARIDELENAAELPDQDRISRRRDA